MTSPQTQFRKKSVHLAIDGSGIAILTLNRPHVHNAFDEVMVNEVISILYQLDKLDHIRVIIVKANGKSFSAGADLGWMQRMVNYTPEENLEDARLLTQLMQLLYTSSKVTIALVQGAVYGGGIGLVACCDIVLATEEASFCLSEVKMGLIPAIISPYVIRAIGERQARRYFLTAEPFDASKAMVLGLVHEIVRKSELLEEGYRIAKRVLENAPLAVKAAKKCIQTVTNEPLNVVLLEKMAKEVADIRVSQEAQEQLKAFLQRRLSK